MAALVCDVAHSLTRSDLERDGLEAVRLREGGDSG
jgi:hypothetical protein